MHKNDRELRTIFGKTYIWLEGDGGRLSLHLFEPMMKKFREAVRRFEVVGD